MLEENIEGEQPSVSATESSSYGKFNSVEDLKQAYDNLEKEFTKKSQMLSDFKKQAQQKMENDAEVLSQNQDSNEDKTITMASDSQEKYSQNDSNIPYWERGDWGEQVETFLSENPIARSHAKEISEMVMQDKTLLNSKRPLYGAWAKWLENNYKTPEQLLNDQDFLTKIQKDDRVRRAVIKEYLTNLNQREKTPPLYASSDVSGVTMNKKTPQTLDDVKEMARKIFSK